MTTPFADAVYWIALLNPRDQWHQRVASARRALGSASVITTEEVLSEVLAYYAGAGRRFREEGVRFIESLILDPAVLIIDQSHRSFVDGLASYKSRPDKGYSLTDCISKSVMQRRQIKEVLTLDHHFAQEGFTLLL